MDMRKWFKEAQYGMMVHWGLYSLLAGEWRGKRSNSYAEWIQTCLRIPKADYERLASAFNPIYFDAVLPCTTQKWINLMWWTRRLSDGT